MKQPVLTLVSAPSKAALEPARVRQLAAGLKADRIEWLSPDEAADLYLPAGGDAASALKTGRGIFAGLPVDLAIQDATTRRKKALIADMDSTMIDQECIDELAAEIGIKDRVAAITARAMNGEIAFEPALRERVGLLRGLPATIADTVLENRITFASGGRTLIATMQAHGGWCALVSGGFTLFSQKVAAHLGFDTHRANTLLVHDGRLSGEVAEPILGSDAKVAALREFSAARGLSPADFIAVGDGANDLPMLLAAGSGVALHAKPAVADKAGIRIDHGDLTALLYLQGYRREDFATP
ncbi:MAG: phosphoserine phosphatase SerB [Nitratireductor sp.]|nr:phosphoserine phosphatase SerB [Nitratireductor sp.]